MFGGNESGDVIERFDIDSSGKIYHSISEPNSFRHHSLPRSTLDGVFRRCSDSSSPSNFSQPSNNIQTNWSAS